MKIKFCKVFAFKIGSLFHSERRSVESRPWGWYWKRGSLVHFVCGLLADVAASSKFWQQFEAQFRRNRKLNQSTKSWVYNKAPRIIDNQILPCLVFPWIFPTNPLLLIPIIDSSLSVFGCSALLCIFNSPLATYPQHKICP